MPVITAAGEAVVAAARRRLIGLYGMFS